MAPPQRSHPLRKSDLPTFLKPLKPTTFSESSASTTSRYASTLVQKIADITWSPTGSLLATCTSSNIRVWNSERPNVKSSIEIRNAHPRDAGEHGRTGISGDVVERVAFAPREEGVLASLGNDSTVRLWDVRTPSGPVGSAGGKGAAMGQCKVSKQSGIMAWHPEGREMVVGRKGGHIYNIDIRRLPSATSDPLQPGRFNLEATENTVSAPQAEYTNLSFSNSGRELFATTTASGVQILDYPSFTHLHTLSAFTGDTYEAEHSPSGSHVAIGTASAMVVLYDTSTWLTPHTLSHPQQLMPLRSLSFSFDGNFLVAGSGDHLGTSAKHEGGSGGAGLHIYHVESGEVVHTVDTTNCPTHVRWHPSRYWVAYGGDPGGLRVVGMGSSVL